MRSFLCICLCAVALPVLAYNEIVPAISYNPSRLGSYTHLKAVETATLKGGLKVVGTEESTDEHRPTINIFKQVTLQDDKHSASSSFNENNVNKITTVGDSESTVVTKQSGGILQGKSGTLYAANGYNGTTNSMNSGLSVTVHPGGTLKTKSTDDNNYSYIGSVTPTNPLDELNLNIDTNTLQLLGTNTITVSADSYTIGGVTIHKPVGWTVSKYSFEERVDDKGTRYKILSAKN